METILLRPATESDAALLYAEVVAEAAGIEQFDTASRRSNDALYRGLKARESEWPTHGLGGVYRTGDCLAPRYLADAVFDGHRLAREFDDTEPEHPRAIIRERPLWGVESFPKPRDRVFGRGNTP